MQLQFCQVLLSLFQQPGLFIIFLRGFICNCKIFREDFCVCVLFTALTFRVDCKIKNKIWVKITILGENFRRLF
ncbi:hypothetical protein GDO86_007936 [Hymenochirus boettgeri]|uniref:Uncharacterized protein n=1 Tax=Hymenochirus boettgeri TaxID=247094 RepID=A0A8T2J146_9PIPI|nr:hypothetical protein GDO86_007936 [Hymenochirus boettgeri]